MQRIIYLAGGCFWGLEEYFSRLPGVLKTTVGYANGHTERPTYEEVCRNDTGHAETVKIVYDAEKISLEEILSVYYKVIDPVSVNRQGGDSGTQYRTGIYCVEEGDMQIAKESLATLQKQYEKPLAVELAPLRNFYPAEESHQEYLRKNPGGYCHISKDAFSYAETYQPKKYRRKTKEELKQLLTEEQYYVTQEEGTEPPFQNAYYNQDKPGIYVDITTGEPLFLSADKFDSGCGWPSFAKPVAEDALLEREDGRFQMQRTEVRSSLGDAHLGHVFPDGPAVSGGLRYCINSAALRFIPIEEMEQEGYGAYINRIVTL